MENYKVSMCLGHIVIFCLTNLSASTVTFKRVAKMYPENSNAILINRIELAPLIKSVDILNDQLNTLYSNGSDFDLLNNTWQDIKSWKNVKIKHFLEMQKVYNQLSSLLKILFKDQSVNLKEQFNEMNNFTTFFDRQRRNAPINTVIVPVLKQLLGIGIQKFKDFAINKIYQNSLKNNPNMIISIPENSLMLHQPSNYLTKLANSVKSSMSFYKLDPTQHNRKIAMLQSQSNITLQFEFIQKALDKYTLFVESLINKRIPIATLDRGILSNTFDHLLEKLKLKGFKLIDSNYMSIYEATTLTYYESNSNQLFTFTKIPIAKGELMTLYEHIITPIHFTNNIFSNVKSLTNQFIALDDSYSKYKLFSKKDIELCNKYGNVYHCPNNQIIQTNKTQSCLYNIFINNVENIKKLCEVTFYHSSFSINKLENNIFKIQTSKPTKLNTVCDFTSHTYIQGEYILKLTENCPEAHVEDIQLGFLNTIDYNNTIVNIPFNNNISYWFKNIPENRINNEMIQYSKQYNNNISYTILNYKLVNYYYNLIMKIANYISIIVILLLILYRIMKNLFTRICKLYKNVCNKKSNCPPTSPQYVDMKPIIKTTTRSFSYRPTQEQLEKFHQNRINSKL